MPSEIVKARKKCRVYNVYMHNIRVLRRLGRPIDHLQSELDWLLSHKPRSSAVWDHFGRRWARYINLRTD